MDHSVVDVPSGPRPRHMWVDDIKMDLIEIG
jgi:hypothetical protein